MSSLRSLAWKGIAAAVIGLSVVTGAAQNTPAAPVNQDGVVAVGGVSILTIRFPAAGFSVKDRADAITDRLRVILADPNLKASDITAVPLGKNFAKIMVKNHLLVTIDQETARANSTTPLKLAQIWTQHLREVLPQLNVQPNANDKK